MRLTQQAELPKRLYALDVLRGLAALAVVFWHWQHFYYVGSNPGPEFQRDSQPFYAIFKALYLHGAWAVDLFFCLSGFVFFWLYGRAICSRAIGGREFFVRRFSRLYPLHIATFFLVALLQPLAVVVLGTHFVYPQNDLYHAILNIFLVPAWGFEQGWSYNAPIWSVSIEVLLYITFFITMRLIGRPAAVCFGMVGLGVLLGDANYKISAGLMAFFAGGLAYLATSFLLSTFGTKVTSCLTAAFAMATWAAVFAVGPNRYLLDLIAFPAVVGSLAATQAHWPTWMSKFDFVGKLSYSSYLLHFPLQILFIVGITALGFSREIFNSGLIFIIYFATLIAISFASYYYLEAPAQKYLRRWVRAGKAQLKNEGAA